MDMSQFKIGEKVGAGSFGEVHKAIKLATNEEVAIKVLHLESVRDELDNIQKEISLLSRLVSVYVVRYLGSFLNGTDLHVVMEYMAGGSLRDLMRAGPLQEGEIAAILREVLSGLAFLHNAQVVHRDIKAANILINADGKVKIADFGVARELNATKRKFSVVGSPYWMAPEVVTAKEGGLYNEKADIWSLGITAIELAKCLPPRSAEKPMKVLISIPSAPPPKLEGASFSSVFKDFVSECLQANPADRPSAKELLSHPFITHGPDLSEVKVALERYRVWKANRPNDESLNPGTTSTTPSNASLPKIVSGSGSPAPGADLQLQQQSQNQQQQQSLQQQQLDQQEQRPGGTASTSTSNTSGKGGTNSSISGTQSGTGTSNSTRQAGVKESDAGATKKTSLDKFKAAQSAQMEASESVEDWDLSSNTTRSESIKDSSSSPPPSPGREEDDGWTTLHGTAGKSKSTTLPRHAHTGSTSGITPLGPSSAKLKGEHASTSQSKLNAPASSAASGAPSNDPTSQQSASIDTSSSPATSKRPLGSPLMLKRPAEFSTLSASTDDNQFGSVMVHQIADSESSSFTQSTIIREDPIKEEDAGEEEDDVSSSLVEQRFGSIVIKSSKPKKQDTHPPTTTANSTATGANVTQNGTGPETLASTTSPAVTSRRKSRDRSVDKNDPRPTSGTRSKGGSNEDLLAAPESTGTVDSKTPLKRDRSNGKIDTPGEKKDGTHSSANNANSSSNATGESGGTHDTFIATDRKSKSGDRGSVSSPSAKDRSKKEKDTTTTKPKRKKVTAPATSPATSSGTPLEPQQQNPPPAPESTAILQKILLPVLNKKSTSSSPPSAETQEKLSALAATFSALEAETPGFTSDFVLSLFHRFEKEQKTVPSLGIQMVLNSSREEYSDLTKYLIGRWKSKTDLPTPARHSNDDSYFL